MFIKFFNSFSCRLVYFGRDAFQMSYMTLDEGIHPPESKIRRVLIFERGYTYQLVPTATAMPPPIKTPFKILVPEKEMIKIKSKSRKYLTLTFIHLFTLATIS